MLKQLAQILALAGAIALWPIASWAETCTLYRVESSQNAELLVYFTRFAKEDNTAGQYKKCRVVKKKEPTSKTFFVTPFRRDANVVVLEQNWPR